MLLSGIWNFVGGLGETNKFVCACVLCSMALGLATPSKCAPSPWMSHHLTAHTSCPLVVS
jgi:hypothetical protein